MPMSRCVMLLMPLGVCSLLVPTTSPVSRRKVIDGALTAAAATFTLTPSPAAAASAEENDRLDQWSKGCVDPDAGCSYTLPSGVRVIDVQEGTGPQPKKGQKVYAHFKVWTDGFRTGVPADSSFRQARVYEWILGQRESTSNEDARARPAFSAGALRRRTRGARLLSCATPPSVHAATDRMPVGADEVMLGMKEGGWRRAIIPAKLAYGEEGLRQTGVGGAKTNVFVVPPNTDVFFDLRLMDGGSGRCEELLHPPGVSEKVTGRLKSIGCVRGKP
jgi:peptidylprolyl isomerase